MTRRIILIAPNVTDRMGGEGIKALQYARYLKRRGVPFTILCHDRTRADVAAEFAPEEMMAAADGPVQVALSRSGLTRPIANLIFQRAAARMIARTWRAEEVILHYIAPVSPAVLRLPPRGYRFVMGPMTGNIYYPPGFRHRQRRALTVKEKLHAAAQVLFRYANGEKRRAEALLVSGYERTRHSLRLAGARDDRMIDVIDAGVSPLIEALPRAEHAGRNADFFASGRFDDHKGLDLAIRAVAQADEDVTLTISGDGGRRPLLEALARELGVAERVRFLGWLPYDEMAGQLRRYRGYVFPSLAEANGIVMQEAMMAGLPVIAVRWGGPAMLGDDDSAVYVEPTDEASVARDLAAAMTALAGDPERAEAISLAARARAEARFRWDAAAESWMAAYPAD